MRKGGASEVREATFKASTKGKEKEECKESGYISEEDDVNFVKKLQLGTGRFRGNLPFKFFACGRVGHYGTKCTHKENHDKGKDTAKSNRRRFDSRRSYYIHEDSDGLSNNEEGEYDQDLQLLMAFEKNTNESNDKFVDALEEKDFFEEIAQLKIYLEEKKVAIYTLKNQLIEKENNKEKLECEIVSLRKELEKIKTLNLRFAKGSEMLDEIIKVQHSPLMKIGLGYIGETSQTKKYSATTESYLTATKTSQQSFNNTTKIIQ